MISLYAVNGPSLAIIAAGLSVSSLISLLFGAALAALGGICVKGLFYLGEMKAARAAIRGELQAILEMLEEERFIQNIEGEIEWLDATNEPREFPVKFRNLYNIVFAGNVSKLGLIAGWHDYWRVDTDFVGDLTRFYYSVQIVIELAEMISEATLAQKPGTGILGLPTPSVFSLSDPQHRLSAFRRLLELTKNARELGRELVNRC